MKYDEKLVEEAVCPVLNLNWGTSTPAPLRRILVAIDAPEAPPVQ